MQLLCTQIPKVQKKYRQGVSIFALWGSGRVKAVSKMLMKLTPAERVLLVSAYSSSSFVWLPSQD